MKKQQLGALLSSICATTMITVIANAEDTGAGNHHGMGSEKHLCQNNTCAKHSECMGHGNDSCSGMNKCKGKGWVGAKDEKECKKKKGIWHGSVAKAKVKDTKSAAEKTSSEEKTPTPDSTNE